MDKRRKEQQKRRRTLLIIAAVLISVILLIVFFVKGGYETLLDFLDIHRDVSVTPTITEVECSLRGTPVVGGIDGTAIIYDEQGVTGYSPDGKWKWNEACSMVNPVVSYANDCVIFADVGGTVICAFNADGLVWRYGSTNPLISVFGGADYICVIQEEKEYLSSVTVFENKKRSELKEIFTRKFGTHYMLTGAVSADGKQLAVSGVYSNGGDAGGIVSFIRMSDGEIFSSENIEHTVYVKLFFAEDGKVLALNSDSLRVLRRSLTASSSGDLNKELWTRNNGQELLRSAVKMEGKYCVAAFGTEGSDKTTVRSYDADGKIRLNLELSGNIIGMHSVGDALLLYTEKDIYLYNAKGRLIGTREAGFVIQGAVCTDSRHAAVYGEGKVLSVSFK